MTPEQQLVQQVQQILNSAQLERNGALEELSLQYAEMCDAANARLVRCADYLSKGMRSEAVNEAHNLPDLLKLATLLQFEGAKKWRNLCIDLELTVFQPLDENLLGQLRQAIEQEEGLAPLLKEYRRSVYQGDRQNCISLLRRIREKDPDNPSWKANLRPLEEEVLGQLVAEAEHAMAMQDLARLKIIYDDLSHPCRVAEPPVDVMNRIRRALMSERASDLKDDGSRLVLAIRKAMEVLDLDALESNLDKMAALEKNDAFLDKPDGWDSARKDAQDLLDTQKRRKERQADFLKAVDEFQDKLVRRDYTELSLRHEWERLLSWEMPVSELLKRQVEETLASMVRAKLRRVRTVVLSLVGLLVVVLIASGIYLFLSYNSRMRKKQLSYMEKLFDNGQYTELQLSIDQLRDTDPELAQSPKVGDLRRKVQDELKAREKNLAIYDEALGRLAALRTHNYSGMSADEILQILRDGENAAQTLKDDNRLLKLKSWRNGWEDWRGRRAGKANQEVRQANAAVMAALDEQMRRPFNDFDLEAQKLTELREVLAKAEPYLQYADEVEKTAFTGVQERLGTWNRDYQERSREHTEQKNELDTLLSAIPGSVTEFPRYRKLLERYVSVAPDKDDMKRNYRNVLENMDMYEGALALRGAASIDLPLDKAGVELAQKLKGASVGTPWEQDLARALELEKANSSLRKKLSSLVSANPELLHLYYMRYRRKNETEWTRLYMPRLLVSGPDKDDETMKIYWGNVYFSPNAEDAPILMHTKIAFPDKLNSRDYDVEMELKQEDNRCEYAKFLLRFVAQGSEAQDMAAYLLGGVQKLLADDKIEPVLRALLIKRMLGMLADCYGGNVPELLEMKNRFAKINTDVPWMNARSSAVKKSERDFEKALSGCPSPDSLVEKLSRVNVILGAALNVQLRCVGSCISTKDSLKIDRRAPASKELWGIFRASRGAVPAFRVISRDGDTLLAEALERAYPGMPVFAPAPGHDALGSLDRLGIRAQDGIRPSSWPENAWKNLQ